MARGEQGVDRRNSTCPAVEARCLARCELEGAENRLRGGLYLSKEMARCLDRCESDFCPQDQDRRLSLHPSDIDTKTTTLAVPKKKRTIIKEWTKRHVGPGRALVAVARDDYTVFLSWRQFASDYTSSSSRPVFTVMRRRVYATKPNEEWKRVGKSSRSSYLDTSRGLKSSPGQRFEYRLLYGEAKNGVGTVASVSTTVTPRSNKREYVTLAAAGTPQISNAMFADTDGDGEIEAVVWQKTLSPEGQAKYVISVLELDAYISNSNDLQPQGGDSESKENPNEHTVITQEASGNLLIPIGAAASPSMTTTDHHHHHHQVEPQPRVRSYYSDMGSREVKKQSKMGFVVIEGVRGKALKEAPGSENSLWSRPRAAGDVDNDGTEEIWTTAHLDGRCQYVLLKDDGAQLILLASIDSPYPLCDGADNSRHDCFTADLDGDPGRVSLGLMGGRHEPWRIFIFDYRDGKLVPRWDSGSNSARGPTTSSSLYASPLLMRGARANKQTSHNVAVIDLDCDGRDEIVAGGTAIDDDGSVLWDTNHWFGKSAHVDGVVVEDVDPRFAGFEIVLFSETGPEYGVYRAVDGYPILEAVAPEFHLQWNLAVNISGRTDGFLDVVGTYGGHFVDGGFTVTTDRPEEVQPFPFPDWPREAHNWHPIDWDGAPGKQTAFFGYCQKSLNTSGCKVPPAASGFQHRPKIFGVQGIELFRVPPEDDAAIDDDDPPLPGTDPSRRHVISRSVVNAIDIVGDHREELIVQMADGTVRAYLNADAAPLKPLPTKLEDYHYRRFLAHSSFPSHVTALGDHCHNLDDFRRRKSAAEGNTASTQELLPTTNRRIDVDTDLTRIKAQLTEIKLKAANDFTSAEPRGISYRRGLRSRAISLKRELQLARARLDLRLDLSNITIPTGANLSVLDSIRQSVTTPIQPYAQVCTRARFGFCFGRATKMGHLIRDEDAALLKARSDNISSSSRF